MRFTIKISKPLLTLSLLVLGQLVQAQTGATPPTTTLRKELAPIVDSLAAYNVVHDHFVGTGINVTKVYKKFESLLKVATYEELIELTDHPSKSVRTYAYWALAKKHYPGMHEVLDLHVKDTASFEFSSGNTKSIKAVNQYMLELVTPGQADNSCIKLKPKAIKAFQLKIGM